MIRGELTSSAATYTDNLTICRGVTEQVTANYQNMNNDEITFVTVEYMKKLRY